MFTFSEVVLSYWGIFFYYVGKLVNVSFTSNESVSCYEKAHTMFSFRVMKQLWVQQKVLFHKNMSVYLFMFFLQKLLVLRMIIMHFVYWISSAWLIFFWVRGLPPISINRNQKCHKQNKKNSRRWRKQGAATASHREPTCEQQSTQAAHPEHIVIWRTKLTKQTK
jgi:hypothetical protein